MSKRPNLITMDPVQNAQEKRDRLAASVTPDSIVPDNTPHDAIPPQTIPSDTTPPRGILSSDILPSSILPESIPPQRTPRHSRTPRTKPKGDIPPETIPPHGIPAASIAKGYYQAFNDLDDRIIPTLDVHAQAVLRRLYRLSHGYGQTRCKVGLGALAAAVNISRSTVQKFIPQLIEKGLIVYVESDSQGTVYEVLPGVQPIRSHGIPSKGIPPGKGSVPSGGTATRHGIPRDGNIKQNPALKENTNININSIEQSVRTFQDLLESGEYTMEMIEGQFKAGYSEGDWQKIEAQLVRET